MCRGAEEGGMVRACGEENAPLEGVFLGEQKQVVFSAAHQRMHQRIGANVEDLIAGARDRVGIESAWSIEVRVCCPEELPGAEASIWWNAELFYARLFLRCCSSSGSEVMGRDGKRGKCERLPHAFVEWLVYHELCELQMWRTSSLAQEIRGVLRTMTQANTPTIPQEPQLLGLLEKWQLLRNQEIECRLFGLIGTRRPGYLGSELGPRSELGTIQWKNEMEGKWCE